MHFSKSDRMAIVLGDSHGEVKTSEDDVTMVAHERR